MKTRLLLITLLLSSKLFAIDRFVNPNLSSGNGTTLFTTIASAITASANGDRILIVPGTYNEPALTLSKSLTLLSQTAGSVINYNGNIIIAGFPGMKLEILGFNLGVYSISSNQISGGSASNRAKVSIIDSKMKDLNMDQSFYESNIIKCQASDVTIFRFGNYIASKTTDLYLRDEPQINLQTNKNRIIADTVLNRLEIRNDDFPTLIANCLIKVLAFYKWNSLVSNKNFIRNNQFMVGSYLIFAANPPGYNFEFSSNLFLSQPNFMAGGVQTSCYQGGPLGGQYDSFDCSVCSGACITFSTTSSLFPYPHIPGYFKWVYNGIDLPCTVPTGANPLVLTKIIGSTGTTINSGDTNHDYYDIDLTVNDRGILGGPYSILNYNPSINPSNGKAYIFDLEMPSDLFPGIQVDINAKGYHRN
jgi:hypothetical protein